MVLAPTQFGWTTLEIGEDFADFFNTYDGLLRTNFYAETGVL